MLLKVCSMLMMRSRSHFPWTSEALKRYLMIVRHPLRDSMVSCERKTYIRKCSSPGSEDGEMSETESMMRVTIGTTSISVPVVRIGKFTYVNMLRVPVHLHVAGWEDLVIFPVSELRAFLSSTRSVDLYGVEVQIVDLDENLLPGKEENTIYITTKDVVITAATDFDRTDFAWPVPPRNRTQLSGVFLADRLRMKSVART